MARKNKGTKKNNAVFEPSDEVILIDPKIVRMSCPNGHPKFLYKTSLDEKGLSSVKCPHCGASPKYEIVASDALRAKREREAQKKLRAGQTMTPMTVANV